MKIMNWTGVEESQPFEKPPAGGYVIRIMDVEDVEDREFLNIVYDIIEGQYTGFYSDEFGQKNPWAHRFVRSYKSTAEGMFKQFLSRLEDSNPEWTVARWTQTCDPAGLIGLTLGVVFQFEDYTNDQGDDKERLNLCGVYSVDDIRAGKFKVPDRKDSRVQVAAAGPAAAPAPVAAMPVPAAPAAPIVPMAPRVPVSAPTGPVAASMPQPPVQPVQAVAPQPYAAYPGQVSVYPGTPGVPYDPNIPF